MERDQAGQLEPACGEWARRKAEQTERTAAAEADPVSRFYLRHGRPACKQATIEDAAAGTGNADPDPGRPAS